MLVWREAVDVDCLEDIKDLDLTSEARKTLELAESFEDDVVMEIEDRILEYLDNLNINIVENDVNDFLETEAEDIIIETVQEVNGDM